MNDKLLAAVYKSADTLKIERAILQAVIEIESTGKIFAIIDGRAEPLIRFEGHYFDKRLTGSTRMRARLRGLASPVVGGVENPAKQKDRWILLEKAKRIDSQAALESTSWGIGQVMGAHWQWLGYQSVTHLVEVARSGVDGQVQLIERYIEKSHLVAPLRERNWSAFARGYNGPGFAKSGYHIKLAQAYAKARDKTPLVPSDGAPEADLDPSGLGTAKDILRLGSSGQNVADLQLQLTAAGYPVTSSGIFDLSTKAALKSFQRASNLVADGLFGEKSAMALAQKLPPISFLMWLASSFKRLARLIFQPI